MKNLLIATLLLAPLPALAQENIVSIVVTSPQIGSIIQQWTMTAEEYQKYEAWVQYAYPCKPVAPATACTLPPAEALIDSIKQWETATINGTVDNVNRTGAQKAAQDAVAGITPIKPNMASKTEKAKK